LPAISEDTGSPIDTLQWAVTGYSLVGAAVIVTSGALGDVFGRRLMFLLGIALFVGVGARSCDLGDEGLYLAEVHYPAELGLPLVAARPLWRDR
jgi:MFS family permease